MAYSAWSVIAGEQPTTAKWNLLGTNDSTFNAALTGTGGINTTALNNPYKFSVWRSAAANTGNATFAVVAFDTKIFDTGSNVSAGVFTAPVAGFYFFSWVGATTATGLTVLSLHKNGTRTADGTLAHPGSAVDAGSGGALPVQLALNDTVDIRAYNSLQAAALDVGSAYTNFFTGFLISAT